jgi:hypothetical protein
MKKLIVMICLNAVFGIFTLGATERIENACEATSALEIKGNYEPDQWGEPRVSGVIANNSQDRAYSNVSIRIDFFNEKQEIVDSRVFDVKADVNPGEEKPFTIALNDEHAPESVRWNVMCAQTLQ